MSTTGTIPTPGLSSQGPHPYPEDRTPMPDAQNGFFVPQVVTRALVEFAVRATPGTWTRALSFTPTDDAPQGAAAWLTDNNVRWPQRAEEDVHVRVETDSYDNLLGSLVLIVSADRDTAVGRVGQAVGYPAHEIAKEGGDEPRGLIVHLYPGDPLDAGLWDVVVTAWVRLTFPQGRFGQPRDDADWFVQALDLVEDEAKAVASNAVTKCALLQDAADIHRGLLADALRVRRDLEQAPASVTVTGEDFDVETVTFGTRSYDAALINLTSAIDSVRHLAENARAEHAAADAVSAVALRARGVITELLTAYRNGNW